MDEGGRIAAQAGAVSSGIKASPDGLVYEGSP
jgi:hypothetical protein